MGQGDFLEILRVLDAHGVEFIVVGGIAAVLQGAPVTTFDLDVVHRRTSENLRRLSSALEELGAFYRVQPERRLRPQLSHLASSGHQLLLTRHGPLDLLGAVGTNLGYDDLISRTDTFQVGGGVEARVLQLAALIELKELLGGEKDRAVLPVLKRTLEEKDKL